MDQKLKKVISVLMTTILMTMCTVNVFAVEQKSEISNSWENSHYEYADIDVPITDMNLLMERGLTHQNDAPNELVKSIEENSALTIDNVIQEDKPLVTTQLISVAVNAHNSNDKIYTYLATMISSMEYTNGVLRSTASNYTKEEQISSSGGEITLFTTLAYEIGTTGEGIGYAKIKSASARARVNVGMVSVNYVKARYKYKGVNYSTRGLEDVTSAWKTSYSNTSVTNIATSAPRIECVDGGMFWMVGAEGLAHVTRGGSNWDTRHTVYESGVGLP